MIPAAQTVRTALSGLGLSILISVAATPLHRAVPEPAQPPACPGIVELTVIHLSRAAPSVAVGQLFQYAHQVLMVLGLALFVVCARRVSGRWTVAVAASLACALLSAFAPVLTVPSATALVLTASVVLALSADRLGLVALLPLLATVLVVPPTAIPLAALSVWLLSSRRREGQQRRWRGPLGAGLGVLALGWVVSYVMPSARAGAASAQPLACVLWPGTQPASATDALAALRDAWTMTGVYVCALAGLGFFTIRARLRSPTIWIAAAYVAAMAIGGSGPSTALGSVASFNALAVVPAAVATLLLAAVGLSEIVQVSGMGLRGRAAATLLVALLPALQWAVRIDARDEAPPDFGHQRLSLRHFRRLMTGVEPGAALVEEEAIVDLLLRANGAGANGSPTPQPIALATAAAGGSGAHAVFALPLAQRKLQALGFKLHDMPAMAGIARVEFAGRCERLGREWRAMNDLSASTAFALAARSDEETGPVVIYAALNGPASVRPLDWPRTATRGFHVSGYRPADAQDRARLERDARGDELPDALRWMEAPHVLRLEQWRTPDAPPVLITELGTAPVHVVGQVAPRASVPRITICQSSRTRSGDSMPGRRL
jgi:hypothetical protein